MQVTPDMTYAHQYEWTFNPDADMVNFAGSEHEMDLNQVAEAVCEAADTDINYFPDTQDVYVRPSGQTTWRKYLVRHFKNPHYVAEARPYEQKEG